MASDERLSGDEIQRMLDEKLAKSAKPPVAKTVSPPTAEPPLGTPPAMSSAATATADSVDKQIERLLASAEAAVKQAGSTSPSGEAPKAFQLGNLQPEPANAPPLVASPLDLLADVELDLRIELGRTNMRLEDILQLRGGAVVSLDKLAGDPVDVFVNDRMIARGEILVLNENFCVRVTELLSGN